MRALSGAPVIALSPLAGLVRAAFAADAALYGVPAPFAEDFVVSRARALAAKPFVDGKINFPPELAHLTYDQYRDIRFNPEKSFWRDGNSPFRFDVLHAGSFYKQPVDVYVVEANQQRKVDYHPDLFTFGPSVTRPKDDPDLAFSGLRLRHPINTPDVWDEFCVFQGASYFRAIAKNQLYGLSARGLAIDTAQPGGEEFPRFVAFWLRRPEENASAVVVEALLDSKRIAGAYRFTIRPGAVTQIDVEMTLFPRADLAHVGIAPLTSMFYFDATDHGRFDDFRPAVHDSDGLLMLTGRGEWLWRPLANPRQLQVSAFVDQAPQGFGLMQRHRNFADYNDLEAHYERRPSVWVEPVGDWGTGNVELVEIPSNREINDNIVAYWHPAKVLAANTAYSMTYRLHWCNDWPLPGAAVPASVAATASGLSSEQDKRLFVIDFTGSDLTGTVTGKVSVNKGAVSDVVVQPNPATGGIRLTFQLDPKGASLTELRAALERDGKPVSQTWLYRWTP